jgi:DNA-binding LacI/PurR family transcriptional regulator
MNERISIKDVARRAGVSTSTVSRVLAGYAYVSEQKRRQVLEAVEQLDYRPDQVARSLRRRRTNLIGLIVSTIENVFFTEVTRAAEQTALKHGYNLIVCNTDERPAQEEAYLQILNQQLVAGVILAPAPGQGKHLPKYLAAGLSLILVNRHLDHLACASITSNDEQAAFAAVNYLVDAGRRRIAAVTGLAETFTTQERLRGYRRALATAGLAWEPGLEISGQSHLEGGYRATIALMKRQEPPDALFIFNNLMTQGVVMALQDLGLGWPDPVDVAGFGAFKAARLYRPPLTLVEQPTHEMGELAVEMLIEQIEGRGGDRPQAVVLQNRLIPREEWLHLRRNGFPGPE